jgi:hypothetical protein
VIVDGDHDGQAEPAERLEDLVDRDEGGLGVEGVEDRLDEQEVDAAVERPRPARRRRAELVEGHARAAGVVDVGGDRERAIRRRADGAGDEARALGRSNFAVQASAFAADPGGRRSARTTVASRP